MAVGGEGLVATVTQDVVGDVRALVRAIEPFDPVEVEHRTSALGWLDATNDVFRRRTNPTEPRQHLVSYFLLLDSHSGDVLLGDHIKSGLWLPSGGHVEPGENPVDTVRRECREELGIAAAFQPCLGERPLFLTITDTRTGGADPHRDVSLWFLLTGERKTPLAPDPREHRSVRWWSRTDIERADRAMFDPHMPRMLRKLGEVARPPT